MIKKTAAQELAVDPWVMWEKVGRPIACSKQPTTTALGLIRNKVMSDRELAFFVTVGVQYLNDIGRRQRV